MDFWRELTWVTDTTLLLATELDSANGKLSAQQRQIAVAFMAWARTGGVVAWKRDANRRWETVVAEHTKLPLQVIRPEMLRVVDILEHHTHRMSGFPIETYDEEAYCLRGHFAGLIGWLCGERERLIREIDRLKKEPRVAPLRVSQVAIPPQPAVAASIIESAPLANHKPVASARLIELFGRDRADQLVRLSVWAGHNGKADFIARSSKELYRVVAERANTQRISFGLLLEKVWDASSDGRAQQKVRTILQKLECPEPDRHATEVVAAINDLFSTATGELSARKVNKANIEWLYKEDAIWHQFLT